MLVCPLCRLRLGDNESTCPRDGSSGIEARATQVPASIRGRFGIVELFAQGQSGDLFVADDQQTGRRGLLKLLRLPENSTPAERARLKRELVKQATLGHTVLSVPLATGDADGIPWVFREWHEGVSLSVLLARAGAMSVPDALTIAAQIASALDELHRAGLLHRDLKPGHVIVEPQPSGLPRVSVVDAGLAGRIETGAVFDVSGTAAYLSPEQAKGKLVSFRSDLYALGCVLYEMLEGQPPFSGDTDALLEAHANTVAPTPSATIPTGVKTLLAQLLSKEPRERPFSAQQVRRGLEPFLPEDANSTRESTQAFDHEAEQRAGARAVGSGTLPPPSSPSNAIPKAAASVPPPPGASVPAPPKKSVPPAPPAAARAKTSVPPPPPGASKKKGMSVPPAPKKPSPEATEELSAVDLAQAEEIVRTPRIAKTLMGIGLSSDAAATAPATSPSSSPGSMGAPVVTPSPMSPDASAAPSGTHELDPLDLEQADEVLAARAALGAASTVAAMPEMSAAAGAPLSSPPKAPPPGSPTASQPPAGTPPWDAREIALTQPPEGAAVTPAPSGAPTASAPDADDDGLDYDDLAETKAYDAEGKDVADEYAPTPVPAPAAPAAVAVQSVSPPAKKKRSIWPIVVLGLLVAVCGVGAVGAGGLYWLYSEASDTVANLELPTPPMGVEPVGENPNDGELATAQGWNPQPAPPMVQPTPVQEPVVAQPMPEEPVVEEPVVEERPEPAAAREPRPQTNRPSGRSGRSGRSGSSEAASPPRGNRFEEARQEAIAHYRARRFPQAATAYERAIQINPRHAGSYAGLGACRLAMRQPQEAVRAYQRAIQLSPRHAGFYSALGQAYQQSGDSNRARDAYRRALSLDPSNGAARAGLQRLGG